MLGGIEDGAVLTRALAQCATIADALQLYQRNRVDRTARIVEQSTANRTLFHLPTVEAIRNAFANRDEGADRNKWLYSYNPLTVPLSCVPVVMTVGGKRRDTWRA